jgi:hypothetical protein
VLGRAGRRRDGWGFAIHSGVIKQLRGGREALQEDIEWNFLIPSCFILLYKISFQ